MNVIAKRREAIETAPFSRAVDSLLDDADREPSDLRPLLLAALKDSLAQGRAEIRRRLEDGASGEEVVRANARLVDDAMLRIFSFAADRVFPAANPTQAERIALTAVGGYGRGELAPFSDIDLLFLLPYKVTARTEQVVEYVLYLLWDLGLKVGHATRSVDECIRLAKSDITIRTAILESRFICGEKPLYRRAAQAFRPPGGRRHRPANSSRRSSPSATRATSGWAIRATCSSPTSRTARAGCAICRRCSGSASTSTASTTFRRAGRQGRADPGRGRPLRQARRTSCGPCAATCTTSPAAPRSA